MRDRSTAFDTGINKRDVFNGRRACVFCGARRGLTHAHIVPKVEDETWEELKGLGWVPQQAKDVVQEPRNGLQLCRNCHGHFDDLSVFVRYVPEVSKFVFMNFSNITDQPYVNLHQKAIGLQPLERCSPMACLFLIHECRVRGRHPFRQNPFLPQNIEWAHWIPWTGMAILSTVSHHFKAHLLPPRRRRRRRIVMGWKAGAMYKELRVGRGA
ncbi:hypothetical protein K435DRAFT_213286 [Dendrothele bispora CBS 962.96]|uniref:HNH nuclease domain-containing protein n=1 Tax=Dendrothele bispora (strain CBS 962.96) TaxID=1314807 RepID=A0A4S8LRX9_DENBC|nr:hypothetical protein K435DRAFT_213286 [Dendrothele bispora CBS 962.96]